MPVSAQCGKLPPATRALFLLEKEKSEPKPAEAESARQRVHLPVHRLFGLAERFVHGGDDEVLEHFHVLGVDRLGLDGDVRDFLLAVDLGADDTAADARREGLLLDLLLRLLHGNSENQADLDAVFDWLCQFNSNVKVYDNGAPRTSLENGDCSVAFTYTTDYVLVKQEDPDGNYELITLPDGWYSRGEWMLAIPASSTKAEEAELLINYIHDAKNYADNVMKYPGVPVNEACIAYLTDEYKELFKAFDIPESANFFTLSSLSSESLEMYDLFISNVMASSNS